jgi:hypothetical protein
MAEAAVPEAAGAAEITALEAAEAAAPEAATSEGAEAAVLEEEETVVVLGRCLLPSTAEIPLPRLLAKCHQAQQELERREWEKLEAERHRLSD